MYVNHPDPVDNQISLYVNWDAVEVMRGNMIYATDTTPGKRQSSKANCCQKLHTINAPSMSII
jgi:hypothetical protein